MPFQTEPESRVPRIGWSVEESGEKLRVWYVERLVQEQDGVPVHLFERRCHGAGVGIHHTTRACP